MADRRDTYRVAVGIDGSPDARRAAELALHEAAVHGGELLVVHAWSPVTSINEAAMFAGPSPEDLEVAARRVLDAEVEHVRQVGTDVPIEARLDCGAAVDVLLQTGRDADLLVVGSRGRGRVRGLMLGSTSQAIVSRANGPVLVVPARHHNGENRRE
jgi:nucleotide-binding universal stress UspA family protein